MNTNTHPRIGRVVRVDHQAARHTAELLRDLTRDRRAIARLRKVLTQCPDALACYLRVFTPPAEPWSSLIECFTRAWAGSYDTKKEAAAALVGNYGWTTRVEQLARQAGVGIMGGSPDVSAMAWDYLTLALVVVEDGDRYHVFLPVDRRR